MSQVNSVLNLQEFVSEPVIVVKVHCMYLIRFNSLQTCYFFYLKFFAVLKVLKDAHNAGKEFRVVVDSRPKFEGKVYIVHIKPISVKRNFLTHFYFVFYLFMSF